MLRRILVMCALTALILAGGGLVQAAAGREKTVGCYDKQTGAVRLIKVGKLPQKCPKGWVRFDWSIVGPAGPTGPQGPAGVAGDMGPAGPAGLDGAPGPAGLPGMTARRHQRCRWLARSSRSRRDRRHQRCRWRTGSSRADINGVDGAPGLPGADGVDGVDGIDGAAGPPGTPGADGPPGPPGADGVDGIDGAAGLRHAGADGHPDLLKPTASMDRRRRWHRWN